MERMEGIGSTSDEGYQKCMVPKWLHACAKSDHVQMGGQQLCQQEYD